MCHPLADKLVSMAADESWKRIVATSGDPTKTYDDLSQIAREGNLEILRTIECADRVADRFVGEATSHAVNVGMMMFGEARTQVEPEYLPDLIEGVNSFVGRVMRGASEGRPLPMNFMEPHVRKELFLVEMWMQAARAQAAKERSKS